MPNNAPQPTPTPAADWNVGDGVTVCGYSDRRAYTIIARPSKTRMIIQRDKATIVADRRVFHPGGFAAHCPNPSDVDYTYTPDPTGYTQVVTLRKDGTWRLRGGSSRVVAGRREFYDVNF